MRSSFEIDSDGKLHVHRVVKSTQAPHPVRLTRQAQIIRVQIFDKCSIDTLLTLVRQCRADIVSTRRASQTIYYSIEDADVVRILRLLSHIYADDPVLPRIRH